LEFKQYAMLDFTNCIIDKLSIHQVGNKTNNEELFLSKDILDISDDKLKELLLRFFLQPFTNPEFYNFTFSNDDFKQNPLYNYSSQVFINDDAFHQVSIDIAKHLYEQSVHPQIKPGDLFVVSFKNLVLENESYDVVGLFKSENKQPFLKLRNKSDLFTIDYNIGINVDKLDKGCLIFNTEKDNGYKICIVDKSNRLTEAQYWKENFLLLKPCSDEFHQTKDFLTITKNYVTKQLSKDFEVTKTDQIDLLNRSVEYFKTHDAFEKKEFEEEVFQDNNIINSFRDFNDVYRDENKLELNDSFEISPEAVKKQARVFKSILKLDKNFHIYIHGNRNLIERGEEPDGRKYYKIYFNKED
jgi:hypothetical protein